MRQEAAISRYREHLVDPPAEAIREKLAIFGLEPATLDPLLALAICDIGRITLRPPKQVDPSIVEIEPYVHFLTPRTLDDLKEWGGMPNRILSHASKCSVLLRDVRMHNLPAEQRIRFERLESEQRIAVRDLGFNLLYGYAAAEMISRPPYKAVVDHMLERARRFPVFVGK